MANSKQETLMKMKPNQAAISLHRILPNSHNKITVFIVVERSVYEAQSYTVDFDVTFLPFFQECDRYFSSHNGTQMTKEDPWEGDDALFTCACFPGGLKDAIYAVECIRNLFNRFNPEISRHIRIGVGKGLASAISLVRLRAENVALIHEDLWKKISKKKQASLQENNVYCPDMDDFRKHCNEYLEGTPVQKEEVQLAGSKMAV